MDPQPKPAPQEIRVRPADAGWLGDGRLALVTRPPLAARAFLAILATLLVVFLAWAHWAEIDEITRAEGKVIPSSQVQVIQSLEGGILSELSVRQGQIVDKGDVLVRIDDTRFAASREETDARIMGLRTGIARLEAEAEGRNEVSFPDDVRQKRPDVVRNELGLFRSRKREMRQSVEGLEHSIGFARRELAMKEPLLEQGIISEVELLTLKRQINELEAQVSERRNAYSSRAASELSERRSELEALNEAMKASEDRVLRTTMRSPVHGVVNKLHINTVGGVVAPGSDILEIVPIDDSLLVEARLRPQDVAFIRPGQKALVKITAYDFTIFGGLKGSVEFLTADALKDERGDWFFHIHVRTESGLKVPAGEQALPIIPGMTAQVDIITGRKTILHYLLNPVVRARENALRER